MVDVKTCLDNAQEKNGYGHHVSGRSTGTYPRRKSECTLIRWYPRRFLRKYGTYQQCSSNYYLRTPAVSSSSRGIKACSVSSKKPIIDSDLGIMPENNGEMIRIGIPPLTEERRRQLAKQCKARRRNCQSKCTQRSSRRHRRTEKSRKRRTGRRRAEECGKPNCKKSMISISNRLKICWLKRIKKL